MNTNRAPDTPIPPTSEVPTRPLADLLDDFINTLRSPETKRAYRRDIHGFLRYLGLEKKDLHALILLEAGYLNHELTMYIQGYANRDLQTHQLKNPKTLNRVRQGNASFFKYLQRFYNLPSNPAIYIEKLPEYTTSATPDLSESEVLSILWYLKEHAARGERQARDFLLVLGLALHALRRSELAGLRWEQIDFVAQNLRIRQKGFREKILPVPRLYLHLLTSFGDKYGRPYPYIFRPVRNNRYKTLNRPISPDTVYRVVKRVGNAIVPSKNISPHSFRTTFVTLGLKWDVDINAIRNGTGHKTVGMVLYYDRRNRLEHNLIHIFAERLHRGGIF